MLCFEFPRAGPATLDAPVCTDMERTMLEPALGPEAAEAADSLVMKTRVTDKLTKIVSAFFFQSFSGPSRWSGLTWLVISIGHRVCYFETQNNSFETEILLCF